MAVRNNDQIKKLREQGKKVYSYSKLSSFHNCQFEYYNTYIEKNKGISNCYTEMGSLMHSNIEGIYDGSNSIENFKQNYYEKLMELDIMGVKFPNESIGNSWKADIGHFLNNFQKMDKKMALEKFILFEIEKDTYVQGYIDAILPSDKGMPYITILDWKTSSKFTGKKLKEAGRQLLMYAYGLQETSKYKVDKVAWFMIKYVYVCSHMKSKDENGNFKVKKKMCNRGKWVKEIRNQLEKELMKHGVDDFEIEIILDQAVKDNNLNALPEDIKLKYWLEDCIVEYEVTDENMEEMKNYILDTIKSIENKTNDKENWQPVEIDKYNSFYCGTLCSHRKTCKFYKEFLENNADGFEKKKDNFDINDLFG